MESCHDSHGRSRRRRSKSTLATPRFKQGDATMVSVPVSLLLASRAGERGALRSRPLVGGARGRPACRNSECVGRRQHRRASGAGPARARAGSHAHARVEPGRCLPHSHFEARPPAVCQVRTSWAAARFPRAPPAAARLQLHDVVARQGREDRDEPAPPGRTVPEEPFGLLGPSARAPIAPAESLQGRPGSRRGELPRGDIPHPALGRDPAEWASGQTDLPRARRGPQLRGPRPR